MSEFITGKPKQWSRGEINTEVLTEGLYHCTVVCRMSTEEEITVRDFDFAVGATDAAVTVLETGERYPTVTAALAACENGSTLVMAANVTEDIHITKDVLLDLNHFTITGNVTVAPGVKAQGRDLSTSDYSIQGGYGKINGTVTGMEAADGYLMITEEGVTSFHCLNLDTVAVNLRAAQAGLYFTSRFGGDEVIQRNIVAFGTAMGAGKMPDFADKTYTRFEASAWKTGCDSEGAGTLLEGILAQGGDNAANAQVKIYSQAYVELADGTRILGDAVCFSLQEVFEGAQSIRGVDRMWADLTEAQKQPVLQLYKTFEGTMSGWNIPNIKNSAK